MKNAKFWTEKKCKVCKTSFLSLTKRNQKFCSNKCSNNFTANDSNRINKIKKTKLERYGSETYVNPEKAKQTCLKKYGTDNASKSQTIIDKIKNTNKERYGTEWASQSEMIKERIKEGNKKKYGVDNYFQTEECRKKIVKTNMEKYGVDNPSKTKKIIDKIKSTNIERYGHSCPLKNEDILKKSTLKIRKRYYNQIKNRIGNKVTFLFDEIDYINTDRVHLYKFKCNKCDFEFEDNLDGGKVPRCLKCYPYISGFSYGEKEILSYLKSILPYNIKHKYRGILNKEIDIYIPDLKIGIEYDGLYWHSEIGGKKNKNYHLNKTKECEKLGVRLIHIFEDEWFLTEKIVKNRLKNVFGLSDKIYARKCIVKEISNKDSNIFLEKYHTQGHVPSKYRIGLFYENKLVQVMTFGSRISVGRKTKEIELLRMASSINVVGGASKLFSYFIKTYNPKEIISYSDVRWGTGNVYEKMKMIKESETPPNYWYFKPGYNKRYHRYTFRKNILQKKLKFFKSELTEWQNMQLNGYDRIWDCGNFKYKWKK